MIKNYFLKFVIATILFIPLKYFSQPASQLTVTPNSAATLLAQTITGGGVTVSGAALNCGSGASGLFSYPSTISPNNLGLTSGILLTNGQASIVANAGSYFCDVANGNFFTDPNLASISSTDTNDVCILTFSFTPVCDSISIQYVFGSEEYNGYVGSPYDDAFGIFLTGPNPAGGTYNAQNIATLPGVTPVTLVSINTVDSGGWAGFYSWPPTNDAFFRNNITHPNNDIAYDGYTIPIRSAAPVVPCSTYFMKIAIADDVDEYFDSGVFIQGNSVSCSTAPSALAVATPVSCGGSTGTASVTVTNYTATPTYSWSPGGQTTSSIGGLTAGTYTCVVGFLTACSGVYNQTLTATVSNPTSFSLSTSSSPASCSGSATGSATIAVSGGTAPYTIAWGTTPTQTTTTVANLVPGTYSITVHDNAGCSQSTSVNVGITTPTSIQFSVQPVCGNNTVLMASSGSAYQWYDTLNNIITGATTQTYTASNVLNGQHYIVSYKDNTTGCRDSVQISISEFNLNFSYNASPTCHGGDNGSISLNPSGTYTFSSYNYNLTGPTTAAGTTTITPISVSNLGAGIYTVAVSPTGSATCLYTYTVQVLSNVIPPPSVNSSTVCNLDTLQLNPPVTTGSTNNWYTSTSPITYLGSSVANVAYSIFPPQISGTSYTDSIKSAAGCVSVYKVSVLLESFQKTVSILEQLKCYNDSTGKVKISVPRETNGPINKPYSFSWYYPTPYTSPAIILAGSTVPESSTESNLHAGYYYCIISAGNCTDTAKFTVINPPKLPTDSIYAYYCPKDAMGLLVADTGYTNYVWHPSNTGASVTGDSIQVPVPNINSYYVTYVSGGCPDTAKIIVPISTHNAFVPNELVNVFSPNGDNTNDVFYPFYQKNISQSEIASQSKVYELKIFDRWGTLMYQTTDYTQPWDGKTKGGHAADAGTYFFYVNYESNCGTNADLANKKGFVELVR